MRIESTSDSASVIAITTSPSTSAISSSFCWTTRAPRPPSRSIREPTPALHTSPRSPWDTACESLLAASGGVRLASRPAHRLLSKCSLKCLAGELSTPPRPSLGVHEAEQGGRYEQAAKPLGCVPGSFHDGDCLCRKPLRHDDHRWEHHHRAA